MFLPPTSTKIPQNNLEAQEEFIILGLLRAPCQKMGVRNDGNKKSCMKEEVSGW